MSNHSAIGIWTPPSYRKPAQQVNLIIASGMAPKEEASSPRFGGELYPDTCGECGKSAFICFNLVHCTNSRENCRNGS